VVRPSEVCASARGLTSASRRGSVFTNVESPARREAITKSLVPSRRVGVLSRSRSSPWALVAQFPPLPAAKEAARLLEPGQVFRWRWTCDRETVASIHVWAEADRVILIYRHRSDGGGWKVEKCPVRMDRTPCTYGGRRAWFRCPTFGCGRRVALLYGGPIFACRHCHRLAYACQRESGEYRVTGRGNRIRQRLGWDLGMLNDKGSKPKGMHWRTFERLCAKHDAIFEVLAAALRPRVCR
jgi:hypothetical protein